MLAVVVGVLGLVFGAIGSTKLKIDPQILQLGSGVLIPLVVGAITKWKASAGLKAGINFALSAIAGGLTVALSTNGDVVLSTWVQGILTTFITSIAMYYGLWKPTGISTTVQVKTADIGIGTPVLQTEEAQPRDDVLPVKRAVAKKTPAKAASKKRT